MKEMLGDLIKININNLETVKAEFSKQGIRPLTLGEAYFNKKFIFDENISEYFEEFRQLKMIKTPVLYWFELESSDKNKAIRDKFTGYRDPLKKDYWNKKYRYTSAYKKHYSECSKTLYVGKVEKSFWGRVVTHLGYNKSNRTAGMQLYHWYETPLFGEIKLNYLEFDSEMKYLVAILEKQLAKNLEPLIGRY